MVFILGVPSPRPVKGHVLIKKLPKCAFDDVPMEYSEAWIGLSIPVVFENYMGGFLGLFELFSYSSLTSDAIKTLKEAGKNEAAAYWEARWEEEHMHWDQGDVVFTKTDDS